MRIIQHISAVQRRRATIVFPFSLFVCVIFLSCGLPTTLLAQYWGNKPQNKIWRDWSINLNFGLTSFFGDLSLYDDDISKKLAHESRPAFGLIGVKHLMDYKLGVGGQLLFGSLKGENSNSRFESSIFEYNIHGRADIRHIFWPEKKGGWSVQECKIKPGAVIYAGIGQFLFDTERTFKDPNERPLPREKTGVPEFVYFFGGQGYVDVACNYRFTIDIALRQARQDKLDLKWDNVDFDYYSYFSLGVTYKIKSLAGSSTSKNRNRQIGRFPTTRKGARFR